MGDVSADADRDARLRKELARILSDDPDLPRLRGSAAAPPRSLYAFLTGGADLHASCIRRTTWSSA